MDGVTTVWRFGRFELHGGQRRLLADGVPLEIGARALDVLTALLRRAGAMVSKAELLDEVWPGVDVEEGNLHVQVSTLRKLLGRESIATVPGRGYQFVLPLLAAPADRFAVATPPPAPEAFAHLPRLLGRDDDLARVAQALQRHGFVTVTGAGGSGKTLLARHLAARATQPGTPVPAWVDLVELSEPAAVVPAVAAVLGVHGPPRDAAALAHALGDEQRLVVLDNAEHLLDAVRALVAALRRSAPGLAVLVTSQAPLHADGESVHALRGLARPDGPCSAEEALRHAAVALFVEHAKQADRRFRFGEAQVADVVAVCASLDGSALGVQLAAALLGQMPLAEVRERLARRDTGPETAAVDGSANVLRSALSWSHALLSPAAQRVFRRLAVAQGPVPLELLRSMVADDDSPQAADLADAALVELVERSLVQCEDAPADDAETMRNELRAPAAAAAPRYRLLEAPRALALEQLRASGERAAVLQRLARAIAPLADAMVSDLWSDPLPPQRRAELRASLPAAADLFAAFEAAASLGGAAAAAVAIRCAGAMQAPALLRPANERLRWAAALRELAATPGVGPELRARAHEGAAGLIRHSDQLLREQQLLAAAAAWREAGQPFDAFRALARAVDGAAMGGRHDEAAARLAEVRAMEDPGWPASRRRWRWWAEGVAASLAGDIPRAMTAWRHQLEMTAGIDASRLQALHSLANVEQIAGDPGAALPRLLEAVEIARRLRMRATLHAFLLPNLVAAQVALGDLAAARVAAAEGWPHAPEQDAEAWWADHLALLAAREGRLRTAARLLGWADAAYARRNDVRQALEERAVAEAEMLARATWPGDAFVALRSQGADPANEAWLAAEALANDDGPADRA